LRSTFGTPSPELSLSRLRARRACLRFTRGGEDSGAVANKQGQCPSPTTDPGQKNLTELGRRIAIEGETMRASASKVGGLLPQVEIYSPEEDLCEVFKGSGRRAEK
jgi:hypothetical protein